MRAGTPGSLMSARCRPEAACDVPLHSRATPVARTCQCRPPWCMDVAVWGPCSDWSPQARQGKRSCCWGAASALPCQAAPARPRAPPSGFSAQRARACPGCVRPASASGPGASLHRGAGSTARALQARRQRRRAGALGLTDAAAVRVGAARAVPLSQGSLVEPARGARYRPSAGALAVGQLTEQSQV